MSMVYWRSPLAGSLSAEYLDVTTSTAIQHLVDQTFDQRTSAPNVALLARTLEAINLQRPLPATAVINTLYTAPHWNSFVANNGPTSQRKLATERGLVRQILSARQQATTASLGYRPVVLPTNKIEEIRGILLGARVIRIAWLILVTLVPWYPPVVYMSLLSQLQAIVDDPTVVTASAVTFNLSWQPPLRSQLPYPAAEGYRDDSAAGIVKLINEGRQKLLEIISAELTNLLPDEGRPVPLSGAARRIQIPTERFVDFPEIDIGATDLQLIVPDTTRTNVRTIIDELLAGGYRLWSEAKIRKDAPLFSLISEAYLKVSLDGDNNLQAYQSTVVPFASYRDENVTMMTEKRVEHRPSQWLRVLSFVHRQLMMCCEAYGPMGLDCYWRYRYTLHATALCRDAALIASLRGGPSTREAVETNAYFKTVATPSAHFLDSLAATLAKSVADQRKDFDVLAPKGTPFLMLYQAFVVDSIVRVAFDRLPARKVLHAGSIDRGRSSLSPEDLIAQALAPTVIRKTPGFTALVPNLNEISKMWFEMDTKRPKIFQLTATTTERLTVAGDLRSGDLATTSIISTRENEAFHDLDGVYWATGFVEAIDLRGRFTAIAEFSGAGVAGGATAAAKMLTPVGMEALRRARDIYEERSKPLSIADGRYAMSLYVDVQPGDRPFPNSGSLEFAALIPFISLQRQLPSVWSTLKEQPSLLDEGDMPRKGALKAPITSAQGVTVETMRGWYAIEADQLQDLWTKSFTQPKTVGRIVARYKTRLPSDDDDDDEDDDDPNAFGIGVYQ